MRPALALSGVGLAALVVRGGFASAVPAAVHPDFALVVVVALGLQVPGASGLLLAAGLGSVADVLTGALLGQHVLLYGVAFVITRLAGFQLDLRQIVPTALLVAALSALHGIGSVVLSRLFADAAAWPAAGRLLGQAAVDGVVAPLLLPLLARLAAALAADDRRAVPLAPRRREA